MMSEAMDTMLMATRCFTLLWADGELKGSAHPAEYAAYHTDPDVQETVRQMMETEPNFCHVLDVPSSDTVYLIPGAQSPAILNRSTFKKRFMAMADTTLDTYMDLVIILFILHEFYGGRNAEIKQRRFMTYTDLLEMMETRCDAVLSSEQKQSDAYASGIAIVDVAKAWKGYILGEMTLTRRGMPKKTSKMGRLLHVTQILEDEGMFIQMHDSGQIRPTTRLDDVMRGYYLDMSRIREVNEILATLTPVKGGEYAST